MSSLEENIQNWIVDETNGLIEGRLKYLPDISEINRLTQGKNKEIWKFVTKHVRSKQTVAFTRKILLLRRTEKEREKYPDTYPDTDCENYVILKNKVGNAEDKVRFIEHTTKNITKHISSLSTLVKNKTEENFILHQKCSIFELATLNLKEKSESLNIIIEKLYTLINKSFANEKTKCFQNPADWKSDKVSGKMNQNFSDVNFNSIINAMMLIVKQKLLSENVNLPVNNLVAPVSEIMSYTPTIELVNLLKLKSQQDSNHLQSNIEKPKQEEVKRLSEIYLQSMKQDFVDHCFQRKKLNSLKRSGEINDMHFNNDIGKLQQDYLSLQIQNECLVDSIHYLEKYLTSELDITENIKENNAKQKSQCQDIEIIIRGFHNKLTALHVLLDQTPKAFSSITFSLESCRIFIDTQLLSTMKCLKNDCFIHVVDKIGCDYKLSLELLKSKEFVQDFLKDFTFMKLNFPPKVWEFLSLGHFHNRHLLIENLSCIKTKLSMEPNHYYYKPDEISTSIAKQMISAFEDNTDSLERVKENLFEIKKCCKNLEIVLKDWWYQNAQYIPSIEHQGKTLRMWLAILNVLE